MATQGVLTNEQFPCPPGNLPWTVADIVGPSSYSAIVAGAAGVAPTGGQAVSKEALGLPVSVIWAKATGCENGQYSVTCYLSPFNPLAGSQTGVILQWNTAATGAEVGAGTNLSSHTIRIMAVGR